MKFNSLRKIYFFIFFFMFCFLFIVPLSKAEELSNDLTKKVSAVEGINTLKGSLPEPGALSIEQAAVAARQMASYDFKFSLNDRLNAIFSVGKPYIMDLAGRDIGNNYNGLIGLQIILQ